MKKKVVWRYPLEQYDNCYIDMPVGAEILTLQLNPCGVCMWAKVDPEAETKPRCFQVLFTGQEIMEDESKPMKYIGTVRHEDSSSPNGVLVLHVFELER